MNKNSFRWFRPNSTKIDIPDISKYVDVNDYDFTLNYEDPCGYFEIPVAAGRYKGRRVKVTFLQEQAGHRLLMTVTVEDVTSLSSGLKIVRHSKPIQPLSRGGRR